MSNVKILNMTPSAFLVLFVIFYQSEGIDINDINEAYKAKVSSFGPVPPLDNQEGLLEEFTGISDRGTRSCNQMNSARKCKRWEVCTVESRKYERPYGRLTLGGTCRKKCKSNRQCGGGKLCLGVGGGTDKYFRILGPYQGYRPKGACGYMDIINRGLSINEDSGLKPTSNNDMMLNKPLPLPDSRFARPTLCYSDKDCKPWETCEGVPETWQGTKCQLRVIYDRGPSMVEDSGFKPKSNNDMMLNKPLPLLDFLDICISDKDCKGWETCKGVSGTWLPQKTCQPKWGFGPRPKNTHKK